MNWISIDNLPDINTVVIVRHASGKIFPAFHGYSLAFEDMGSEKTIFKLLRYDPFKSHCETCRCGHIPLKEITHWAPLPEPPKD